MRLLLLLIVLLFACFPVSAAGLFQKDAGPVILLAEVQGYGDFELKPEMLDALADRLSEDLRQQKLSVVSRYEVTNETGRHDMADDEEGADISDLHMAAIVGGHHFDYGYATAKLKHYADETLGRTYFYDEERREAWAKDKSPYFLPAELQKRAAEIASAYGADYLFFVNVKDVDVRLKGTVFASHTDRETRGKKMRSQMDYFLVNPRTGRVYEGHVEDKKNAQLVNFGLGKTGKGMNVMEMLDALTREQCEEMAKDVAKKGLKAVERP